MIRFTYRTVLVYTLSTVRRLLTALVDEMRYAIDTVCYWYWYWYWYWCTGTGTGTVVSAMD